MQYNKHHIFVQSVKGMAQLYFLEGLPRVYDHHGLTTFAPENAQTQSAERFLVLGHML
jgi:hypothetical protein